MKLVLKKDCPYCKDGESKLRLDEKGIYYFSDCCDKEHTTNDIDDINIFILNKK